MYENPAGMMEAVKLGWSWTGFFFSWVWCFIKKLNVYGAGIFIGFFVIGFIMADVEGADFIFWVLGLGVQIYLGSSGNKLVEENLVQRGYDYKTLVSASTPEGAIALYAKEKQDSK